MKPGSQNARLLAVLADGEWHTSRALHERVGFCRLNSRVAELRSYGHHIHGEHIPGKTGTDGYRYRLVTDKLSAPVPSSGPREAAHQEATTAVSCRRDPAVAGSTGALTVPPCPHSADTRAAASPLPLSTETLQLDLFGAAA